MKGMVRDIFGSQILNEGISEIVYHITKNPQSVFADSALLGSSVPAEAQSMPCHTPDDKGWFISTARSMSGIYNKAWAAEGQVTLEMDGSKIAQSHSGAAVDYWKMTSRGKSEMEDRIWLDVPALKPLDRYLKRILISVPAVKVDGQWKVVEWRPQRTEAFRKPNTGGTDPLAEFKEVELDIRIKGRIILALEYGQRYNVPVVVFPLRPNPDSVSAGIFTRKALTKEG